MKMSEYPKKKVPACPKKDVNILQNKVVSILSKNDNLVSDTIY